MLNSIRKSEAFTNDLKRFDDFMKALPEGAEKNDLKHQISNLITEVKKIDDLHVELIYNKQMPSLGTEFRDKINIIRKNIETKIKEISHKSKSII